MCMDHDRLDSILYPLEGETDSPAKPRLDGAQKGHQLLPKSIQSYSIAKLSKARGYLFPAVGKFFGFWNQY